MASWCGCIARGALGLADCLQNAYVYSRELKAREVGLDRMTMEDIEVEIRAARAQRRTQKSAQ